MMYQPIDPTKFVHLRRSIRQRKPAIEDEFMVYLGKYGFDIVFIVDLKRYKEVVTCPQSKK